MVFHRILAMSCSLSLIACQATSSLPAATTLSQGQHARPQVELIHRPFAGTPFKIQSEGSCASSFAIGLQYMQASQCLGKIEVYENGSSISTLENLSDGISPSVPVGCTCGENTIQVDLTFYGPNCSAPGSSTYTTFNVTKNCEEEPEDCANSPYILVEDTAPLSQNIQQIIPISPQNLDKYAQLLDKLKSLGAQLVEEGVPVNPPQPIQVTPPNPPQGFQIQKTKQLSTATKTENLLKQYSSTLAEYEQARGLVAQSMQALNSPLEDALQKITEQFDLKYDVPDLPSASPTLEDFKHASDILIGNTYAWLEEENTFSFATAMGNYVNLVLVYHRLQREYLSGNLISSSGDATPAEPFVYQVSKLAEIQDTLGLIQFIAQELETLKAAFAKSQQTLNAETEALISEAENISQLIDSFEIELTALEQELAQAEGGFSIQQSNWFTRIDGGGWKGGITTQGSLTMPANRSVGLNISRPAPIRAQNLRVKTQNNVNKSSQQAQRAEQAYQATQLQLQNAQTRLQTAQQNWQSYLKQPQHNVAMTKQLRAEVNSAQDAVTAAQKRKDKADKTNQQAQNNKQQAQENKTNSNINCQGSECRRKSAVDKKLGNLKEVENLSLREVIRQRGGNQSNVKHVGHWADATLREVAEAAVRGERSAEAAIKIAKQAYQKGQKY